MTTTATPPVRSRQPSTRTVATISYRLDIIKNRLPDVDLAHLHAAALTLGLGGVGYYPDSNFVHVDVGPVREWRGA